MPALDSQIAVVTGAARGVGEAIAYKLASIGAHVILVARDRDRLAAVQQRIENSGAGATVLACDLLDTAAIEAVGRQISRDYQRCDILVNNAGIARGGTPLHEMSPDDWDATMNTNLRGPYLMIRALAPLMIAAGSGHIINISSLAGRNPLPNNAAYAASKWGLNGLTYSVAEELRRHKIRVSAIAPGSINTDFADPSAGKDPNKKLRPDDIATVVATLVTQAPQSFISEVLIRPTQKP